MHNSTKTILKIFAYFQHILFKFHSKRKQIVAACIYFVRNVEMWMTDVFSVISSERQMESNQNWWKREMMRMSVEISF